MLVHKLEELDCWIAAGFPDFCLMPEVFAK
jgi:hypothetical protein